VPDHSAQPRPVELIELAEAIRGLLARSDALGLPYVAIHLCNALESLEADAGPEDMPIDPDGAGDAGPLPG